MAFFSTNKIMGILGGGQLGKMLLDVTKKWDISTAVLDPSAEAPARIGAHHFQQGDLMDYDTVYAFGQGVDCLTFEIENVNVEALSALEKKGIVVYPQSRVLKTIQNKCTQKLFYQEHQIPTAPFDTFKSIDELKAAIARGVVSFPFIWKAATLGYDGYGVKVIRSNKEVELLPEGSCLAEEKVVIEQELSVIVCRNPSGAVALYPPVEMEFHPDANQVEYVLSPARISATVSKAAETLARKVSLAFQHVGLLAVEMFLTPEGELLVNEVAPRPHNSGHYSIEGAYTSQFEQHIRALLDLPLGATQNKVAAVMVNLVGKEGHQGNVVYKNMDQILAIEGVTPHLYGKKETRPFRKMGHVTIINQSLDVARDMAQQVKETIEVITK
ncbi:MAG: 5-(carboxyamino)imidazole ribonucleotide synthase [Flavobacteriaceae bacterium]